MSSLARIAASAHRRPDALGSPRRSGLTHTLWQKLALWLSNHSGHRDSRLPKALKCLWTGRDVFNIKEDARILQRVEEIVRSGKVPIAAWNIARSELWNALTDKEQAAFDETAEQWIDDGPDPELRAL